MAAPIRELPPGYRQVLHLVVTEGRTFIWLNIAGLALTVTVFLAASRWAAWAQGWFGPRPGGDLPWWLGLPALLAVLVLHEFVHAAAIRLVGHTPRIGAKLDKGVLYATADGALFRRGEFIMIALAPLVVLTLTGLALLAVVPSGAVMWVLLAVAVNGGGAIGDLWMTWVALRYPSSALVKDEEDGIRVFVPAPAQAGMSAVPLHPPQEGEG